MTEEKRRGNGDKNKELCCEKWRNVNVRVVRAALDSGAELRG